MLIQLYVEGGYLGERKHSGGGQLRGLLCIHPDVFKIFYKNAFRYYFIIKIVKGAVWEEFHENMESQTAQPGRDLRVTYTKPS